MYCDLCITTNPHTNQRQPEQTPAKVTYVPVTFPRGELLILINLSDGVKKTLNTEKHIHLIRSYRKGVLKISFENKPYSSNSAM